MNVKIQFWLVISAIMSIFIVAINYGVFRGFFAKGEPSFELNSPVTKLSSIANHRGNQKINNLELRKDNPFSEYLHYWDDIKNQNLIRLNSSSQVQETLKPSDEKSKILIIFYWASWCNHCNAFYPNLKKVLTKYKPNEISVIAVSVDKSKALAMKKKHLFKDYNFKWVYLQSKDVMKSLKLKILPVAMAYSPRRFFIMKIIGKNKNKLKKFIEKIDFVIKESDDNV